MITETKKPISYFQGSPQLCDAKGLPEQNEKLEKAKAMSVLINTPDSGRQIFPFILHGTIQTQKQEGPRNIKFSF